MDQIDIFLRKLQACLTRHDWIKCNEALVITCLHCELCNSDEDDDGDEYYDSKDYD